MQYREGFSYLVSIEMNHLLLMRNHNQCKQKDEYNNLSQQKSKNTTKKRVMQQETFNEPGSNQCKKICFHRIPKNVLELKTYFEILKKTVTAYKQTNGQAVDKVKSTCQTV